MKKFIATGAYAGLSPVFPGSLAALWAVAALMLAMYFMNSFESLSSVSRSLICATQVCIAGLSAFGHYALHSWSSEEWSSPDAPQFVLDEIFGQAVTYSLLIWAPVSPTLIIVYGFLSFRIIDMIKLPGAREIDSMLHTASGALLDDLISALYATSLFVPVIYWVSLE